MSAASMSRNGLQELATSPKGVGMGRKPAGGLAARECHIWLRPNAALKETEGMPTRLVPHMASSSACMHVCLL